MRGEAPDCSKRLSYMATYMAINDRFNYEIFHRMAKEPSQLVKTIGVAPDSVGVKLLYDPWYVASLSTQELAYMISHEVGHVVMHHFDKSRPTDDHDSILYDLAADLAINCLFKPMPGVKEPPRRRQDIKLPDGQVLLPAGASECVLPENFGFSPLLSHEAYVYLLSERYKNGGSTGSGKDSRGDSGGRGAGSAPGKQQGTGASETGQPGGAGPSPSSTGPRSEDAGTEEAERGSHGGWASSALASAAAKEWISSVQSSRSWGSLPGEVVRRILAAQETSVPWETLLREKYGSMHSSRLVSTYKRPSRRFGYPWCSKKMSPRDKKLVLIDTSASVGDADLQRFKAETDRLSEAQCVYYMTFDTRLHQEEALPWTTGFDVQFRGGGGTNIAAALRYAQERSYQDCVVLTDGYFAEPRKPEGVEVLWVITRGGSRRPACFGEVVMIT